MAKARRPEAFRAPLEAALEVELHELDVFAARLWFLFGIIGVVAAVVFSATISATLGLACGAVVVPYLCWFVFLVWRLARGPAPPALRILTACVEATIPWSFFLALDLIQGAGYALASWVPPMLFSLVIFGLTLRLRFAGALASGVVGAVAYLALYFTIVRPALPADLAQRILYQPPMQLSRAVSMLVAGTVAALAGRGLRTAIARAEIAVRERELFGKYHLQREIARGGMATVFEALYCPEGGFERRVAVKRIHPHLAEQPKFVEFFRSEAEISSRLGHPNIVQVLDFGRVGESYFLAMEYVEGMTLSSLLRRTVALRERIAPSVVGAVAGEILAGLEHAHEVARGVDGRRLKVVHRDLCPQNVLLSKNGEVKITDFGVARALKDAAASHTKTVVGHTGYIAPEQARGHGVDPRADLFPLGVMMWEMLAGRRLFFREGEAASLKALLEEPVLPVSEIRTDVDPAWDAFLGRALARDPEQRFASAAQMLDALRELPGARVEGSLQVLGEMVERLGELPTPTPGAEDDEASTVVDSGAGPPVSAH